MTVVIIVMEMKKKPSAPYSLNSNSSMEGTLNKQIFTHPHLNKSDDIFIN